MNDIRQFLICQSENGATRITVMQYENSVVRFYRTVANAKNFEMMTRMKI